MTHMTRSRGLTLVEILIALVVSSIALTAALLAARSQQAAYDAGNRLRAAQETARSALLSLESKVPLAGFGMDAPLALDFGWYDPTANGTCPSDVSPCQRDRTGDSDELVFYARNPAFWVGQGASKAASTPPKGRAWNVTAVLNDTVTLDARAGDAFPKGRILQVVCAGTLRYAYVTVDQTQEITADGSVALTLASVDAANPFRRQDVAAGLDCITTPSPTAKAFQIDRYRYHVRPVSLGGTRRDPYLVLDHGVDTDLDGDVDTDDELLIAEGIESMQVAYVFAEPTIAVAGSVPGTAISLLAGGTATPDKTAQTIVRTDFPGPLAASGFVYESSSFYPYGLVKPPAQRLTNAQANIRRLVITLVTRSPLPDNTRVANMRYGAGSPLYRLNQNAAPTWITAEATATATGDDGYQRSVVETSVSLPNMTARTMTYY